MAAGQKALDAKNYFDSASRPIPAFRMRPALLAARFAAQW